MPLDTKVGLGPGHIVLDGDPAPPNQEASNFRPMSIVAKRSSISATAGHLFNFVTHHISGTYVASHFKFGRQIDINEYYRKRDRLPPKMTCL